MGMMINPFVRIVLTNSNEQNNQHVIRQLNKLQDELGWHEFDDEVIGQFQYMNIKIMELIEILVTERRECNE